MSGITVTDVDGRLLAVKRRSGDDAIARIEHERLLLQGFAHPGIVELHPGDPEPGTLRTVFIGPDTWATAPPTAAPGAALAVVATTLADLHAAGASHGALAPEHVVVDTDGQPVLCGFGDWTAAGAESVAADVHAFVAMAHTVAPEAATMGTLGVLDQLEAGRVDLRGTARRLAVTTETETAPAATPQMTVWPKRSALSTGRLILVLTAVVAGFAVLLFGGEPPTPAATIEHEPSPLPTTTTTTTTATVAAAAAPTLPPPSTTEQVVAPTVAADAPVVVHAERRYAIGAAGDQILLGDWNCDGSPTIAVLRPGDGTIALFDGWPEPGHPLPPAHSTVIHGARSIEPTDDDCPAVRVRTDAGSQLVFGDLR